MSHVPADRPHFKHWPKRLPREVVVPETSLWENLNIAAKRYPDKAMYIFFGRALSFSQAREQSEAVAGWLQEKGVKKGDRVLLYMPAWPRGR